MSDVTQILGQIEQGDGQAAEKLLPLGSHSHRPGDPGQQSRTLGQAAGAACRQAAAIGTRRSQDRPQDIPARYERALTLVRLAVVNWRLDRSDETRLNTTEALALLEELHRDCPHDDKVAGALAKAYITAGNLGVLKRPKTQAVPGFRYKSVELLRSLVSRHPENDDSRRDLFYALKGLSSSYLLANALPETESTAREMIVVCRSEFPRNTFFLAQAYSRLAQSLDRQGRLHEAIEAASRGVETYQLARDAAPVWSYLDAFEGYRAGRYEESVQQLTKADALIKDPEPASNSSPACTW